MPHVSVLRADVSSHGQASMTAIFADIVGPA